MSSMKCLVLQVNLLALQNLFKMGQVSCNDDASQLQFQLAPPLVPAPSGIITRARNNIFQPKRFTDGTMQYPVTRRHRAFLVESEPVSHVQALEQPKW